MLRLQINITTLLLFLLTSIFWLYAYRFIGDRDSKDKLKWRVIFFSFFGYAWMGFGVLFIARFFSLIVNPIIFSATRFPLVYLPTYILNITWLYLSIYWVLFCMGYLFLRRSMSFSIPAIIKRLNFLDSIKKVKVLDAIFFSTLVAIIVVNVFSDIIPKGLITPLGHYGNLYVVPATIAWFLNYEKKPIGLRRVFFLLPGIVLYILSPYREHLLTLLLCWFLPFILFVNNISFKKFIINIVVVLIIFTAVTSGYRSYRSNGFFSFNYYFENINEAPWTQLIKRIHGFDSMALTIFSVPSIFPYSNRNFAVELVNQVIPSAISYNKRAVRKAREFSTGIWAVDEKGRIADRTSSMIAPSMPGDLFSSNSIYAICIGAFFWGILVGILEFWNFGLKLVARCSLLLVFGPLVGFGFERDFVNASATIIQVCILLLFVLMFFPFRAVSRMKINHLSLIDENTTGRSL